MLHLPLRASFPVTSRSRSFVFRGEFGLLKLISSNAGD
jgi:hypothetical protein